MLARTTWNIIHLVGARTDVHFVTQVCTVPTTFIAKNFLKGCLGAHIKNQLTVIRRSISGQYFDPLTYLSLFMPLPHCLD